VPYEYQYFCGRPNWYGMRWANLLIQQCDLLISLGTRLGIQQTGFNWEGFAPNAQVIQIDIDENELKKGFPKIEMAINANANELLPLLVDYYNYEPTEWLSFIKKIREGLDHSEEKNNKSSEGFIELQSFLYDLGEYCSESDVIIPCSSGGSFTGMMQMFNNKQGQRIITDSNLASMGYGLPGAIGACLANPTNRVVLVEGDGGFAQNMQEMGTVIRNNLNLKIFLMDNGGYGTIKNSQRASFDGNFIGCDSESGLMLPKWETFFSSFGIQASILTPISKFTSDFVDRMNSKIPQVFIVKIDPNQEYFPKIVSRKKDNGQIVSNPLHLMNPPLTEEETKMYMPWIN
jgi:acetolactate synthase-1/2/3 large subunit